MKCVIFEGVSGGGKTTLFTPVHQARQYQDLHIHRFTATHWVYAKLMGREIDEGELLSIERSIQEIMPTLVVWCRVPTQVALYRVREKGDKNVLEAEHFEEADALFEEWLKRKTEYRHVLELNTDQWSIGACVDWIGVALEEIRWGEPTI